MFVHVYTNILYFPFTGCAYGQGWVSHTLASPQPGLCLAHVSSVCWMTQACKVQKNHCIILQAPTMVCVCRSVTIDPEECHLFKENFVELNKTPTEMHTS